MQAIAEKIDAAANGHVLPSTAKKLIVVASPTLGAVSMQWAITIADLVWPMNVSRGIIPMMDQVGGEIAECRNRCVKMILEMERPGEIDVHSIFWLDDDVITHRMAICALARHERPIASGVYFCKGEVGAPLIFPGPSQGTMAFRPNETMEAWGWAQGLCLIEAGVYKRMRDECDLGEDKYGSPRWYHKPDFAFDKNGFLTAGGTEDFPFFQRAGELGYKPLIDCSKFAFGWHYDMAKKVAFPRKQWDAFLHRQPIVWPGKGVEEAVIWD
jgi:hypothetical protein